VLAGLLGEHGTRLVQPFLPLLCRDGLDRDGKREEGLQSEEKMGDLTGFPTMTSRQLQFCPQRPESHEAVVSEGVEALRQELEVAGHRLGVLAPRLLGLG
jgi:hypothetical protein